MRPRAALALLAVAASCGRGPPGAGTGAEPPAAPPAAAAPATSAPAPAGTPPAPTPLPAAPRDRKALVGGCGDRCRDARAAVAGFLDATARGRDDPEAVLPFLDATRLVVDGEPLGERWAAQWRELRSATRADGMREAARDLGRWTTGLGAGQVRDLLAAGARPVREWSTEAAFEVAVPGGPPWRVALAPRGLEWLVVEVRRDGAGETPGADPG